MNGSDVEVSDAYSARTRYLSIDGSPDVPDGTGKSYAVSREFGSGDWPIYNRLTSFDDYKLVIYRNRREGWVAEIPAIAGCHALMPTAEEAVCELAKVFQLIEKEHRTSGRTLPRDSTEIIHTWCSSRRVPARCRKTWVRERTPDGNHERERHQDARATTIPIHGGRAIGPPLFFSILEQRGIDLETFERLR